MGALGGGGGLGDARGKGGIGWKAGEIGGNYPALLKICNRKKVK